jgi:thiol-disulfide isomerase/thioredoxin
MRIGKNTGRKRLVVAMAAFLCLNLGQLAAQGSSGYGERLEALGFQVFAKPIRVPALSLPDRSGGRLSLANLTGKVVLLNFWATWCPPCRAEMPSIERLWKAMKGKDFTIAAVDEGESAATVNAFFAKNGYSYPVALDVNGGAGDAFAVQGIPTTYLLDKNGLAIARVVGGIEYDSPEALALFAELAAKGAAKP